MRYFAPAALEVTQDISKEDNLCIIIEKIWCWRQNKTVMKTLRNGLRYWEIYESI